MRKVAQMAIYCEKMSDLRKSNFELKGPFREIYRYHEPRKLERLIYIVSDV